MVGTGIMTGVGTGIGWICIFPYLSPYSTEKVRDFSYSYPVNMWISRQNR